MAAVPGLLVIITACWAYAYAVLGLAVTHPAHLVTVAAVSAAALLVVAIAVRTGLRPGPAYVDPTPLRVGLRQRARHSRIPRQLDPDAPGRPRPRAPGRRPSTA
ncbi:DUF6412 domain-containing protein [Solwaraspora sp. WMMD406]|uniref:DUF6412 domain-containing protein n=1 Tax=Solwaraspora sp. WMMD406 TaxID=3016095 RepID=UPI0024166846|nr:DUF6412 domain-containing protein [Solwaraspora sp. WMMD406]MDG4767559.1 DUF6412 domain-containing protein [Solwaraspora sp. WMMD406]